MTPGALWNNGLKFRIVFPAGNSAAGSAAIMLRDKINYLNPKFHVDYTQAPLGLLFLPQMVAGQMPMFVTGLQSDFPDPHDLAYVFMHSNGVFAASQCYSNPTADNLIEAGIATPDGPLRQQIYYDIQALYHNDVPSVPLVQPVGRQFERDWMREWYYNPVYQGQYVYHTWKAKTHFGDINNDGKVDMFDAAQISAHWYPGPPVGPEGYSPNADITGGVGGTTDSLYGPVAGIPDGKVDIADAVLVSANWG